MCLDILRKILCKQEASIPAPSPLDDIDSSEVLTILSAEFPGAKLYIADSKYKTTTKEEFMRFINNDSTDWNQYISEYYDCDDFSFSLMGHISNQEWGSLPFAIVWADVPGGAHAINCFIDINREVWIVEPQSDNVFKLPSTWKPYFVVI